MREESSLSRAMRRVFAFVMVLSAVFGVGGFAVSGALASGKRHHQRHHRARHHHRKTHRTKKHHGTTGHGTAVPTHGTTAHGSFVHPLALLNANSSNNWSGYNQGSIEQGSTTSPKLFSSISGNWTVPTVTQHSSGQAEYSSDWIGIGGGCVDAGCTTTDSTLIQDGTEQDVDSSGAASYSAWWEVIPGPSMTITSMTIHPGDRMSSTISATAPGVWTITLKDTTNGQSYSTTVPYSSTEATAEWIQETPLILGTNAGFAALPNLTSPSFDLATTNGAPANLKASEEMNLVDSNGNVIGAPSSPDPDADGFNACTWAGTCTAPSSS
jgi:Peptidase A4 family